MPFSTEIQKIINSSSYRIFAGDGFVDSGNGLEIDRIIQKEGKNIILSLRVRKASKKPVKIYSFVVAEFILSAPISISKVLENNWLQCSEISYKNLDYSTKKNTLFLQRDQNPYSFQKEYGYIDGSIISEWFTSIKFNGETLFIGAVTTADQFSQMFIKKTESGVVIRVTCQYDGLTLNPGQVVTSEKIFFGIGEEDKIQKEFARSLAKHMKVGEIALPIKAMCCSYYWNGNKISEESINKELDVLESLPERLDLDYFQLDAGYTRYFGDWLDYKERFPDGFEPIIKRIKSLGYKPGIWISPFSINPGTKLHDHHPGWLLKDIDKKHFEGRLTSPFDTMSDYIDLEVLDPTNPEVKSYLREVLTHFKNLGFELFKTDFTYPVCLASKFSRSVTRAQALREGFQFIRDTLGDVKLISCITQLSPVVGLIDYVRTGIDTLNPFVVNVPGLDKLVNEFMLESNLNESKRRSFLNGIVWRADPDMLIFRKGTGILESTLLKHRKMAEENNMCLWIGDSVANMDESTKMKVLEFFNKN